MLESFPNDGARACGWGSALRDTRSSSPPQVGEAASSGGCCGTPWSAMMAGRWSSTAHGSAPPTRGCGTSAVALAREYPQLISARGLNDTVIAGG